MAQAKPKPIIPKYHSAIDGKFVSAQYAKTHPKTTVKESGPHHRPRSKNNG
jgi:hypothetical protein